MGEARIYLILCTEELETVGFGLIRANSNKLFYPQLSDFVLKSRFITMIEGDMRTESYTQPHPTLAYNKF